MRRAAMGLVVIAAMLWAAPAVAQRPADDAHGRAPDELDPVPTLARLREILRESRDADGWYDVGSASCRVDRRVVRAGVEAAVLRLTAARLSIDEELLLAVRGPGGWRVVTTLEPLVQNGHGWRGAIEVTSLRVTADTIEVGTRSWVRDVESPQEGPPSWTASRAVCTRSEGDTWSCASG